MALLTHTLRRRASAAATVLALGAALPLAIGATPAYAQGNLGITKTHAGDFPRGGQGFYRIVISNNDQAAAIGATVMTDVLPQGLTIEDFYTRGPFGSCGVHATDTVLTCNIDSLPPDADFIVAIIVNVADDAPCTVTNTATIVEQAGGGLSARSSDQASITGGTCNGNGGTGNGNGGNGNGGTGNGSFLPTNLNLSGTLPTYNSTTNNTFHSQGTTNTTTQDSHPNP
ncbi:DUF11 domain-containing protein [Streptomyces sp. NBC_00190]|uniref:hypothetical protein n=1 Tax=unclassified Streptomyces TaxID=2593676 RepID=UPI002E2E50C6|nr:hypothetical protein [Streptomyces sp. NBC_00190]WSW47252.1 DUF11 domain-containing protein [Streptomyces sp. NBC_01001]WSZ37539.1 DUF11 domain-containing protein [Streptomyces sp. NBC_00868]